MMRDRMERFVLLPFSVGCVSESSVAVAVQRQPPPRRSSWSKPAAEIKNTSNAIKNRDEDEESLSSESMKSSSFRFLPNSKTDLSTGFHRLCKSFKNFSQLFVYKEEEMEEVEKEIEIGFPTDVKHVTHIGLDGCTTTTTTTTTNNTQNSNSIKWENLMAAGLLSFNQFDQFSTAPADDGNEEREALPERAQVKKKKKNLNHFFNQLN